MTKLFCYVPKTPNWFGELYIHMYTKSLSFNVIAWKELKYETYYTKINVNCYLWEVLCI